MKLNGSRSSKPLNKNKETSEELIIKPVSKKNDVITPIIQPVTKTTPKKFSEDESLRKTSVFVSGWQTPYRSKESVEDVSTTNQSVKESNKRLTQTPTIRRKTAPVRKPVLVLFIIVLILSACYYGALFFEKTTIFIQKKQQTLTLDHEQFSASKNPQAPIHFEIMIVSDVESKNMILTESQDVSVKAKGLVTFYNEFSTKAQTISANSYLADSNGKTYRTDTAVTIPGYKMNGTKIVPGQVNVGITAFLPGDSYNSTEKDFTISSFKGTAKFKKIYAKATNPISGGAQGLVYVLGATEKGNLNAIALSSFKSRLLNKVNAEVPKGYLLYGDALAFSYTIDDGIQSKTPDTKININSSLAAVIIKEDELSDTIVKMLLQNTTSEERSEIEIPDISKLSFAFTNPSQAITKDMEAVSFTLSGAVNAIWYPNIKTLQSKLIGISKIALPELFKTDPGIVKARATLFPPWEKYLPTDSSKIHITIE